MQHTSRKPFLALVLLITLAWGCTQHASPTPVPRLQPTFTPALKITKLPSSTPARTSQPSPTVPQPKRQAPTLQTLSTAALRSPFIADAKIPGLPQYNLNLRIDSKSQRIRGVEIITFTNTTSTTLADIVVRLYPNFPHAVLGTSGNTHMTLDQVLVDATPTQPRLEAQGTAARISLPDPLEPNASTTLQMSFEATFKPRSSDNLIQLTAYYPMLAVNEMGRWRTDVTNFPDRVYAQTALYLATVQADEQLQVVASGVEIAKAKPSEGQVVHQFISGPVREWALFLGTFDVLHGKQGDIAINVYQPKGSALDTARALQVTEDSLRSYEQRFGSYPYNELDLIMVQAPGNAGFELPGLVLIEVKQSVSRRTDIVVAHEVAHQYWYGIVGNDIYNQPWIDESLAQYSATLAIADRDGKGSLQQAYADVVLIFERPCRQRGDPPAGLGIAEYTDFATYVCAVYGRGGVFLHTLRNEIGAEAFSNGLRIFYRSHRYGIARRSDFKRAMEEAAGQPLDALFAAWLGE